MNTSMVILGICALLIVWELSAISFTNKKIKVKGKVPGQKLGISLFALVCAVIMWIKWGNDSVQLMTIAAIIAAGLLNFAIKNGLSDYGVYINGWSTPYKDIKYYDVEEMDEGELKRLRIAAMRKDITLLFTEKDLQLAIAYMDAHKVYDIETYKVLKRQQKEEMRRERNK